MMLVVGELTERGIIAVPPVNDTTMPVFVRRPNGQLVPIGSYAEPATGDRAMLHIDDDLDPIVVRGTVAPDPGPANTAAADEPAPASSGDEVPLGQTYRLPVNVDIGDEPICVGWVEIPLPRIVVSAVQR
jgi:hypothetical protein